MSDLKSLNHRLYKELFENRNMDAIDDLFAEDAVEHDAPPPGVTLLPGREGIKQLFSVYLDAFNPLTVEVHAMYQDGDTVITRLTFHGTHAGEFAGIPPTGNRLAVDGMDITRFEDGRVAEHWGQMDAVALMTQIGALPPME